ncbi:MAG: hypothetical protein HYY78_03105 [Betaproteobacteria bacterium]|nr:hypothetical protein [Betaproteobacteria bacterium]
MENGYKWNWMMRLLLAALLAIAAGAGLGAGQPAYELDVEFDVPRSRIIGTATVHLESGAELTVEPGDLRILSVTNGSVRRGLDPEGYETHWLRANGTVRIRYEGTFRDPNGDVIDGERIVLGGIWYPVVEGTYRYRLNATLPAEFLAVSEAETVRRTEARGRATYAFDLPHPQRDWDGISFVASTRWVSRRARYKDVELSVHLLRPNAHGLEDMIEQAQRYLERLEGYLGAYPFKRLSIVENPVPIKYSYSLLTYVLLSQKSVASKVPEDSSLHHEIAHQWIGSAVLGAYDGGNWLEGLTSYLSDHLEGESLGIAWQRRQRMMAGYQSNVADRAPVALSSFTESSDRASRVNGYAKSALVFHMLRRMLGDGQFFAVMREFVRDNLFRAVSWTDIRKTFERATAADLGWFFGYWVDGVATPELGLESVTLAPAGRRHELRFTVTQKPPALPLAVPLTIYFEPGRSENTVVDVSGAREDFRRLLDDKPVRVVLDENYDVFRRLTPAEIPPTINTLLTRPRVTVVAPPAEQAKFARLLDAFERGEGPVALQEVHQGRARKARPAAAAPARRSGGTGASGEPRTWRVARSAAETKASRISLVILGTGDPLIAALFGRVDLPRGGFTITVLKHPRNPEDVVAILTAVSKAEVDAAYGELVDRPRYSSAAFSGGKLISYELRRGQRGISKEIAAARR